MEKSGFLMDVQTVSETLGEPRFRPVDCRFNLAQTLEGHAEYLQAHIPGAVYANLDLDLAAPIGASTGRHPLPDIERFARTLGPWPVLVCEVVWGMAWTPQKLADPS